MHLKNQFVTDVLCGTCSGRPHYSKLSHLMRPPRVTHADYMHFQYRLANTATPSSPLDNLEKEKGRQYQKRNKDITKVSDRRT